MKIKSICVYCGSQTGNNPKFMESANVLGRELAAAGIGLVYGGGSRGIMGAVSDGVRGGGGHITGIIPDFLLQMEGEGEISATSPEILVVGSMHERKQKMFELSDAFIALPGGIGTLEEIIEIMTWAQLGRHSKPISFLNIDGYWDGLLAMIETMKGTGFLHHFDRVQPHIFDDPKEIVDILRLEDA